MSGLSVEDFTKMQVRFYVQCGRNALQETLMTLKSEKYTTDERSKKLEAGMAPCLCY